MLPVVPMFHAGSWCIPYAAAMTGFKLVDLRRNQPERLCRLFNEERVTHSAGVPTVWLSMIDHVERTGATLDKLDTVIIGGSSAPPRHHPAGSRERGVRVNHLWGMTEMSPVGTVGAPPGCWDQMSEDEQFAYLSRPGTSMFGVELRAVDDDGNVLPRDGKVPANCRPAARGWSTRYFKEDSRRVDADNWFDTGDVAVIHPDNSLQLTDRAKDVIKSGGEWISSIEIENVAVGCPGVTEAAAIGIPHPKWDERPLLLIVRDAAGSDVSRGDIRVHLTGPCRQMVAAGRDRIHRRAAPHGDRQAQQEDLRDQYRDYRFANAEAMVRRQIDAPSFIARF